MKAISVIFAFCLVFEFFSPVYAATNQVLSTQTTSEFDALAINNTSVLFDLIPVPKSFILNSLRIKDPGKAHGLSLGPGSTSGPQSWKHYGTLTGASYVSTNLKTIAFIREDGSRFTSFADF